MTTGDPDERLVEGGDVDVGARRLIEAACDPFPAHGRHVLEDLVGAQDPGVGAIGPSFRGLLLEVDHAPRAGDPHDRTIG